MKEQSKRFVILDGPGEEPLSDAQKKERMQDVIHLGTMTLKQMLSAIYDESNPLYSRNWYSECGGARFDVEEEGSRSGDEIVYVYYHHKKDETVMTTVEHDTNGLAGSSAGFRGRVELGDIK